MKRVLLLATLALMLLLTACSEPPDCECDHIAVLVGPEEWECASVSELEEEIEQNIPGEAYNKCNPPKPDIAASIWLAAVCEPNDGFSADGNMTIATDFAGSALYAGPSATGPWTSVGVSGPPWVVTRSTLETLGAQVGAATMEDIWFKAGDGGTAARLGSLIANREGQMDAICGG
jgi:hypothetical protein